VSLREEVSRTFLAHDVSLGKVAVRYYLPFTGAFFQATYFLQVRKVRTSRWSGDSHLSAKTWGSCKPQ
jgi:hypothetical protein